ncbi:MAG: hypothetical protein AAF637_07505 [Pseudomonadota bacterium]
MQRYNKFYVVVVADYNDDDAHGIVQDNLYYWLDQCDLSILSYDRVDVAPFNTVETGYMLARRALNPLSPSERQVFFVNTAPRMDDLGVRRTNQGEGFVWARLNNGKQVFAVNSGHSLSFIKPEIAELHQLNVPESAGQIPTLVAALRSRSPVAVEASIGAGQFRSGYIYPVLVAKVLSGDQAPISPAFDTLLGPRMDPSLLPDLPEHVIAFRDGYGNFKTSIPPDKLPAADNRFAVVACHGQEIIAHVASAIFDVPLHHFSIAPGSTILAYGDGSRRQFVEVVLRGGHAARAFAAGGDPLSMPAAGDAITWRPARSEDFERLDYARDGRPPDSVLRTAIRV